MHGTNDTWCTPEPIWGPLVEHLGPISLDPMTNPRSKVPANERWTDWDGNVARFGLIKRNAYEHSWDSYPFVFVNGPWSVMAPWCKQAAERVHFNHTVLLVPVRPTGGAWQKWIFPNFAVLWLNFRIQFDGAKDPIPGHCALCYRGDSLRVFKRAFRGKGTITCQSEML